MIQNILDQAPDAIFVANGIGTILYANRHVAQVFGYAPEELAGQNLKLLIHPDLWEAHDRHLERLRNTSQTSIFGLRREVFAVHRDGRELIVELHVSPLVGENEPLYIATVSDIMARKQAEFQREVLADQLTTQNKRLRQILDGGAAANRAHQELMIDLDREIRALVAILTPYAEASHAEPAGSDGIPAVDELKDVVRLTRRKLLAVVDRIGDAYQMRSSPEPSESPNGNGTDVEAATRPSGRLVREARSSATAFPECDGGEGLVQERTVRRVAVGSQSAFAKTIRMEADRRQTLLSASGFSHENDANGVAFDVARDERRDS
jgi:PAS domain S-box-containing protein